MRDFDKNKWFVVIIVVYLIGLVIPVTGFARVSWDRMKPAGPNAYKYDDLSKHVNVDFMCAAWVGQPLPKDDPVREYIEKTFNVSIKFQNLGQGDLTNKATTRFASGDYPDVIFSWERIPIQRFYSQGFLVEDHKEYLKYLPTFKQQLSDADIAWATSLDGKMFGIPKANGEKEDYYILIRQDWLKKLGFGMPKTDDELFKVAYAFTFNDPDGNGKKDTYGIQFFGATGDRPLTDKMDQFAAMYGNPRWSISKEGKVTHPVLDGGRKRFLEFLKRCIDAGVVDPDWYTIGWADKKVYAGTIGMVRYHTDLTSETVQYSPLGEATLEWWWPITAPLKSVKYGTGGRRMPNTAIPKGIFAITKKAAEDPVKVKRILHILDWWQYPNEGMGLTWFGYKAYPTTTQYFYNKVVYYGGLAKHPGNTKPEYVGVWDWGVPGNWYQGVYWSNSDKPGPIFFSEVKQAEIVEKMPRYPGDVSVWCQYDPEVERNLWLYESKEEIKFIRGTRSFDEWDDYVKGWLAAGGQQLIDTMTKQLKARGMIK